MQPIPEPKEADDQPSNADGQLTTEGSGVISFMNDRPFTPLVPIQDKGWKVVSRRRRDVRTPTPTVGLVTVHINGGGG